MIYQMQFIMFIKNLSMLGGASSYHRLARGPGVWTHAKGDGLQTWFPSATSGQKLNRDGSIMFQPLMDGLDLVARNTGRGRPNDQPTRHILSDDPEYLRVRPG
jgi:hypothetical protein